MNGIYERIAIEKTKRKLNNNKLGELIGKSGDAFRMALKRKSLSDLEIEKLEQFFGKEQEVVQIKVNQPQEVFKTKAGSVYEELASGRFKLTVPFVPVRAQARYLSDFTDAEFLSELNSVSFIVDRVGKGRYLAFEIQNDSMDDDSKRSIPDGAIVLGRELGKQHWRDKLKTRDFPYWIIVHKQGMLCKEIIAHDVERGIITCHSLNDSPEYQDFDVKLDDCYQLFNIVKKQI